MEDVVSMDILAIDLPDNPLTMSFACFFCSSRFSCVGAKDATRGRPSETRATNVRRGGMIIIYLKCSRLRRGIDIECDVYLQFFVRVFQNKIFIIVHV